MELRFNIGTSQVLSQEQKVLIRKNLASRISLQDDIIMACQTHRSQLQNKLLVTEDFVMLIQKALIVPKKRVKTKPGKAAVQKRLDQKKKLAEKKSLRGKFRL